MEKYSVEEILELVFTTENIETGSQPPKHIAWVIFENGTVFLSGPDDTLPLNATVEDFSRVACQEMEDLGPAHAGTASADFNVDSLNGWYPEDFVFMVSYDHPNIVSFYVSEEKVEDITVGILCRTQRDMDVNKLKIRSIRSFDKTLTLL